MFIAVKRILLAGSVVALAGLAGCPQQTARQAAPPKEATAPTMTQAQAPSAPAAPATGQAATGTAEQAQAPH
ncbi:MAG: hypothetical protein WBD32_16150, partial [Acidobacteriaceae bacterium]